MSDFIWEPQDYQGFLWENSRDLGQVKPWEDLSRFIFELSSDPENKVLVEIGTWNGLGSTRFFMQGLLKNKEAEFWTLENHLEKVNFAKSYWQGVVDDNHLKVNFVHGSVISNEDIDEWLKNYPDDFSEEELYWIDIDKKNTKSVINLPFEKIDVLLIDGGFFGHMEYLLLKDKCKYILLDDTTLYKSKQTREELLNSSEFHLIHDDLNCRNGISVFKRN